MRRAKQTLRIFLNYRREDTAGHAGRLFDALAEQFGRESVFMDIDTIRAGEDFTEVVRNAVGSADSVVALIGSSWLDVREGEGRRRLDNPEDHVRLELEGALQGDVRVVPVLVQGAKMPSPDQLPPSLAPLARRHAVEVSDNRWSYDIARLVRAIDPHASAPSAPKRRLFASRRRLAVAVAAAVAVIAAAVVVPLVLLGNKSSTGSAIRIIDFKVKDLGGKTHVVRKGGTYGPECHGDRLPTRIDARYIASGMSFDTNVTITLSRNRQIISKTNQLWGTPVNGYWAYRIDGPFARSGTHVLRFVSRGKLLGQGSLSIC